MSKIMEKLRKTPTIEQRLKIIQRCKERIHEDWINIGRNIGALTQEYMAKTGCSQAFAISYIRSCTGLSMNVVRYLPEASRLFGHLGPDVGSYICMTTMCYLATPNVPASVHKWVIKMARAKKPVSFEIARLEVWKARKGLIRKPKLHYYRLTTENLAVSIQSSRLLTVDEVRAEIRSGLRQKQKLYKSQPKKKAA